jgi:hypothetical protein
MIYLSGGYRIGIDAKAAKDYKNYLQHSLLFGIQSCLTSTTSHCCVVSVPPKPMNKPINATTEIAAPRTVITSRVNQHRICETQTGANVQGAIAVTIPSIKIIR